MALSDLFIVPYWITESASGTLTFAINAGTPIVSTPFPYAYEMLSNYIGYIVEFNNPGSIGNAIEKHY